MSQDLFIRASLEPLSRVLSTGPSASITLDEPSPLPLETNKALTFPLETETTPLQSLLDTTIEAELILVTTTETIDLQTSIEGES